MNCNQQEFYPDKKEVLLPPDAPEALDIHVGVMECLVDADHVECKATMRSRREVLIFLNNAPIIWNLRDRPLWRH